MTHSGHEWRPDALTRWSRRLLRVAARLVPGDGRREWLDEWEAELWQLRRSGQGGGARVAAFLFGAFWHGAWEWKEGWTMESVLQDTRYALRTLARSPGFAVAALIMLASSIGASTALFTVLEEAILSDPPFPEPERLVVVDQMVGMTPAEMGGTRWSYPRYQDLMRDVSSIEVAAGYERRTMTLTELGDPSVASVEVVTPSLFELLGLEAARGRLFGPDDEDAGAPRMLALVSHDFWAQRFGSSDAAIGSNLTLDQLRFEIVGVLPSTFPGLTGEADIWLPMAALREVENDSALDDAWNMHFLVLARLVPGVTLAAAQEQVRAFGATLKERFPAPVAASELLFGADLMTFREARSNPTAQASLLALFAAVLLLLLVATANLAALLAARGASRQQEVAVRTSLGAAPGRILRQMLTESLVLAALGGLAGTVLAGLGVDVLGGWLAQAVGTTGRRAIVYLDPAMLSIDWRVVVFATLLTAGVGVGFGLLPAWRAAQSDPNASLRGGRPPTRRTAWRLGITGSNGLIVLQVAVALVLLSGATVMIRSLSNLQRVDLGFDSERLLTATYALTTTDRLAGIDPGTFHTAFVDRVRELPGVSAATLGSIPMGSPTWRAIVMGSDGRPQLDPTAHTWLRIQPVPETHLATMGIELIEGRDIERTDDETSEPVIVLGETAARYLFPDGGAIGRRIRLSWSEFGLGGMVVGIARDVTYDGLGQPPGLQGYVSVRQAPRLETGIMVRTTGDPTSVVAALRAALAELNPNAVLTSVMSMDTRLADITARPRVVTMLLSLFGGVALFLVGAGLYATIAFAVVRRTRELGLRASLGAPRGRLVLLVLRQELAVTGLGILAGLAGSLWAMRFLEALVFGADTTDPRTFAVVSGLLFGVALLAAYLPARRALRIDPVVALRAE
ncbi:MAG: ADOP family duplicated permease [Gemmatimonadota bacterium]